MGRPVDKRKQLELAKDIKNKYEKVIDIMSMKIAGQLLSAYRISISEFYDRSYAGYLHHGFMYYGITEYGGGDYYMGTPYMEHKNAYNEVEDVEDEEGTENEKRKEMIQFIKSGRTYTDLYLSYRNTTNIEKMSDIFSNHPFKDYIKRSNNRVEIGYTVNGDWVFNRAYGQDIHGAKIGETGDWMVKHDGWRHRYWQEHEHFPENAPAIKMKERFDIICKNLNKESKKTFDKIFKGR